MINNYFCKFPICPVCGNPLQLGYPVKLHENGHYKCMNPKCGSIFLHTAKIDSLFSKNNDKDQEILRLFCYQDELLPLGYWIDFNTLNKIEQEYMDWFLIPPKKHKYIISWPWNTVRFLGIIICELLQKFPMIRICLITKISKTLDSGKTPTFEEIFDTLSYLPSEKFIDFTKIIAGKRRIRNQLAEKRKQLLPLFYRVDAESVFRNSHLLNYIVNSTNLRNFSEQYPKTVFRYDPHHFMAGTQPPPEQVKYGERFWIINAYLEVPKIKKILAQINVDFLFIEDLNENTVQTILRGNIPHVYAFKYPVKQFLPSHKEIIYHNKQKKITFHSIYSKKFLGENGFLKPKTREFIDKRDEGDIYNPLSNDIRTLFLPEQKFKCEFEKVTHLEEINSECEWLSHQCIDEEILRYLLYVKDTALEIIPTQNNQDILYRRKNITFYDVIDHIESSTTINQEKGKEIMKKMMKICSMPNPVRVKLIHLVKLHTASPKTSVGVLVSFQEKQAYKKIISKYIDTDKSGTEFEVISLKDLNYWTTRLLPENEVIVLSLIPPHRWLQRVQRADKMIFIGSERNLDKLEQMYSTDFYNNYSFYPLNEKDDAPSKFKPFLVRDPNLKIGYDILHMFNKEMMNQVWAPLTKIQTVYDSNPKIAAESEVLLVLTGSSCFFLPYGKTIILYNENEVLSIEISKEMPSHYIGWNVLFRPNIGMEIKKIFMEYMFEFSSNISLYEKQHIWGDFVEVYEKTIKWLKYLGKLKALLTSKYNSEKKAADEIYQMLHSAGISQKKNTIINKWLKPNSFIIFADGCGMVIYDQDRPLNSQSLQVIYKVLNPFFPDEHFSTLDADNDYSAIIALQNFRSHMLLGNSPMLLETDIQKEYFKFLHKRLIQNQEISETIISDFKNAVINQEVSVFTLYEEYSTMIY